MKPNKCRYPDCNHYAQATFALVPLCELHHEIIWRETRKFYGKKQNMSYEDARPEYLQIADQISWSRDNLDIKRGLAG